MGLALGIDYSPSPSRAIGRSGAGAGEARRDPRAGATPVVLCSSAGSPSCSRCSVSCSSRARSSKPRGLRDSGRDRLCDRGAHAPSRGARPARRSSERAPHSLLRTRGGAGGQEGRFWGALVRGVMRHPVLSLVLAAGLLLALAAPVLALDTGTSGPATLPDRFESKQGFLLLNEEFPKETTDPVEIAVAGEVDTPAIEGRWRASSKSSRAERSSGSRLSRQRGGHGRARHRPIAGDATAHGDRGRPRAARRRRPAGSRGRTRRCTWAAPRPRSSTTTTRSTTGSRSSSCSCWG